MIQQRDMGYLLKICWNSEFVQRREEKTPSKLAYIGVFFDVTTYGKAVHGQEAKRIENAVRIKEVQFGEHHLQTVFLLCNLGNGLVTL